MVVNYLPYEQRTVDAQYHRLLGRILRRGVWEETQLDERAKSLFGVQLRFPVANGAPVIVERDLTLPFEQGGSYMTGALGELCAFINGARTQAELKEFGCRWWARWVTAAKCAKRGLEKGDLGPGSYGAAWRYFPTTEGEAYDQIATMLEQMRQRPHLRTHYLTPFIPQYTMRVDGRQQRVVVVPCHGLVHIKIYPKTHEISLHHFQRSADVPVGLPANLVQYFSLLLALGQVLDLQPKELVYTISDAHIYEQQIPDVRRLLATEPQRLPTVQLDQTVGDLFAFRHTHFALSDYHPQSDIGRIWTPV